MHLRRPNLHRRRLDLLSLQQPNIVIVAEACMVGSVADRRCLGVQPAKMDKHKAKFWEEARMLAALNHPNVLRFYGVVTASASEQTVVGIMTEYMPGGSLSNYLRWGPFPTATGPAVSPACRLHSPVRRADSWLTMQQSTVSRHQYESHIL